MEKIEKINAIKSILNLHCKTGATIQDIESEFREAVRFIDLEEKK